MGTSLPDAFAAIPGYRNASGQRKSRPAILTLAVCAMLSGARSAYAIHKWGCCQSPGTVRAMGFTYAKKPAVSCLHRVFSGLGVAAFGAAVVRWSQISVGGGPAGRGGGRQGAAGNSRQGAARSASVGRLRPPGAEPGGFVVNSPMEAH